MKEFDFMNTDPVSDLFEMAEHFSPEEAAAVISVIKEIREEKEKEKIFMNKDSVINLRVNKELKRAFRIASIKQGKTMTEALEELMRKAILEQENNK